MITKKEMGYYGRPYKNRVGRKTKGQLSGQVLNRGFGKIPLERIRFRIPLTSDFYDRYHGSRM